MRLEQQKSIDNILENLIKYFACLYPFLCLIPDDASGALVKLRKTTISVVMSVRLEQISSNWTDFYEIVYLRIYFLTPFEKFKFIKIRQP
jgi:hypothetical protein